MEQMMLFSSGKTMTRCSKWRIDIICLLIFLVSIAIRLVKLSFEPLLLRDGALYLKMAEIWHQTGNYLETTKEGSIVPPLPLWCIKTLMNITGNSEIAGRSLSIFLGGVIPVICFILAREISRNIRFSLLVALCFILHPNLVSYSIQPLRENYFISLIGLLLIVMVRNFRTPRTAGWIVCGAIVGIAFFCRLEALEFLIIVATEIALLELKREKIFSFLKSICIFLLAFVLTSLSLLVFADGDYSFISKVKTYSDNVLSEAPLVHLQ